LPSSRAARAFSRTASRLVEGRAGVFDDRVAAAHGVHVEPGFFDVARRRELCRVALVPSEVAGVEIPYAVRHRAVVGLEPGVVLQMIRELHGLDELFAREPFVHVPYGLVVDVLYRVAVVGDALDDEFVAYPGAHVRARVAVGFLGVGEQVIDALIPLYGVAEFRAAERVEVGERLALDRLRSVDVPPVREVDVYLVLGVAVGGEEHHVDAADFGFELAVDCLRRQNERHLAGPERRAEAAVYHAVLALGQERRAAVSCADAEDRANERRVVYKVGHEFVAGEYLHLARLDLLFGHTESLDAERVVGVAVCVDDAFDRLVGDLPELGHYLGRGLVVLARVDNHYPRVADGHAGRRELPSDGAVDVVLNGLVDRLLHLPRPFCEARIDLGVVFCVCRVVAVLFVNGSKVGFNLVGVDGRESRVVLRRRKTG